MNMELRHLRYFVAVAEEENITRAARRLHVSQPPLSRQIRDLEQETGLKLFERHSKSVSLTDAGRFFLAEARAVIRRADEALASARAVATGNKGRIQAGYSPSPTAEFLSASLRLFQEASPGIRVVLHDMTSDQMQRGLQERTLDVALTVRPSGRTQKGLKFECLKRYRVGALLPRSHRLARKSFLTPAQVAVEPLVVYSREDYPEYVEWVAGQLDVTPGQLTVAEECDGVLSLIAAVEAGRGVSLNAEYMPALAGPRLCFVPLSGDRPPMEVGVFTCGEPAEPIRRFIECIRAAANSSAPTPRRRHARS